MFTRIDLLPVYDSDERDRAQSRWDQASNMETADEIRRMIREGAGEHFLESDFQQGRLPMLWDEADLRGIMLTNEDITFPTADNFMGESFAYGRFFHCTFRRGHLCSVDFAFAKFYRCTFIDCTFTYASFYGSTFEESQFRSCDFPEHASFVNSDFRATSFKDCFFIERAFFDCRFDERTAISIPPLELPHGKWSASVRMGKQNRAEFYKGCKEAYRAGEVVRQSRGFYLLERQAITRHNTKHLRDKFWGFLLEITTGYGLLPARIVATMVVAFGLLSIVPVWKLGFWDGLLLSAGAFFTFGANADKASLLGGIGKVLYIVEPFVGVSLVALFITILARYWFLES